MRKTYPNERTMLVAVKRVAAELDIEYRLFSGDWVVQLRRGEETHHIVGWHTDYNSQAARELATDKVAASELLEAAGLPHIPHTLLQSIDMPTVDAAALTRLLHESPSVVVKPLQGGRGLDVARFSDVKAATEFMKSAASETWAGSPYVEIARELRLVVFQGQVMLAYEKYDPVTLNGLRMFNLHLGAKAKHLELLDIDSKFIKLATSATGAINLTLGAVDIVLDETGEAQVLEINSGFSLEHFAATSPENHERVVDFYTQVVRQMFAD